METLTAVAVLVPTSDQKMRLAPVGPTRSMSMSPARPLGREKLLMVSVTWLPVAAIVCSPETLIALG